MIESPGGGPARPAAVGKAGEPILDALGKHKTLADGRVRTQAHDATYCGPKA